MALGKVLNPWGALAKAEEELAYLREMLKRTTDKNIALDVRCSRQARELTELRKKLATACPRDPVTGRFRPMGG